MSVYLSDELCEKIKEFPEVNVSEVMRNGLEAYLENRKTEATSIERLTTIEEELKYLKMGFIRDWQSIMIRVRDLEKKLGIWKGI